jgi:hypothetical protein
MKRSYITGVLLAMLLISLCGTGCTTIKYFVGDGFHESRTTPKRMSSDDRSRPRKKVLIAPLINIAGFKDERVKQLTDSWVDLLKKDGTLSVTSLTAFESPQSAITSTSLGIITDPALLKKAEEMGMDVLVTLTLVSLDYTAEKGVIWPFNKLKGEYEVSIVVNAIDVISGEVVFSLKNSDVIEMGEMPKGLENAPLPDEGLLNKTLYGLQSGQSETLLDFLSGMEWFGKIALEGAKIRINGGNDIGIEAGNVFEVLVKGSPVRSATGRDYYLETQKAGEISVTEVSADHAYAVPLDNKTFEDGQLIRLKRE